MSTQEPKRNYTYRAMRDERQYGLFWYSGLWNILRPVLVGLTVLVIVSGLLYSLWRDFSAGHLEPVDVQDDREVVFQVESGQSLTRIARNLEQSGLIRSHTVFKYYCDFAGLGQKLQSGTYLLKRNMTIQQIADQLTTGDGSPIVRNVTLIPGWTIEDFAAYLLERGVVTDTGEFLSLCRSGTEFSEYYYIADILSSGKAKNRKYALEGYLAPNTYEVYTNATPKEIIGKLLSQTEKAFPGDMQDIAVDEGYTMDEIIILASLIEKEAKTGDFPRVSAVFRNRLKRGMPLGSDVTIHYITGVRKMSLTDSDLAVSSPYNTYTNNGLPPGPICNPSTDAINAALYPDETFLAEGYLYFCAMDPASGSLYFSRTLEEHNRAVAQYRPLWQAYDRERGIE